MAQECDARTDRNAAAHDSATRGNVHTRLRLVTGVVYWDAAAAAAAAVWPSTTMLDVKL